MRSGVGRAARGWIRKKHTTDKERDGRRTRCKERKGCGLHDRVLL
jgi:hypothetical protein